MLKCKKNYNLKKILIDKEIRQYELVNAIRINKTLISKHINGEGLISPENIEKIAKLLRIKKEEI